MTASLLLSLDKGGAGSRLGLKNEVGMNNGNIIKIKCFWQGFQGNRIN